MSSSYELGMGWNDRGVRVLAIAQSGTLGGAERSLLRVARRLPEHGIEVEISSLGGELTELAAREGLRVWPGDVGPVSARGGLTAALGRRRWAQLAEHVRPDVHLLNGVVAHRAVPGLRNAPRVPWLHEMVERSPLAWSSDRFWRSVPAALTVAPNVARSATAHGAPADRLRMVGAPVEPAEPAARPPWADGRPIVGFAGRLDAAKAPTDLLAAMRLLPRDARLVVIGRAEPSIHRGRRRAEAERYAQRVAAEAAALGERALMLGSVGAAAPLMHWFDVLVMPSHIEGLGLVAVEALAAGTPVVLSSAVGMSELIEPGVHGEVVRPGEPARLAEAIGRVLEQRDRYAAAASSAAEPFIADRVTAAVAEALHEAVGR
jgi:glycosyltransferase involved in cell wall biosynthesis